MEKNLSNIYHSSSNTKSPSAGTSKDLNLVFESESTLAKSVNMSRWPNTGCGHNCCTCDSECK